MRIALPVLLLSAVAGAAAPQESLQRGLQLAQQGDCNAAIGELRAALAAAPNQALGHRALAFCETRLGRPERATESYEALTRLLADDWQIWNDYGANLVVVGRAADALAHFEKAVALNARSADAWYNLGSTYLQLNQPLDGFQALSRLRELAPGDEDAVTTWREGARRVTDSAGALTHKGNYSEAKRLLLAVQAAQQDTALWNNLLGYAEFRLNQPEDALRHLQQALHLEPNNEDYLLDLGEFLIHYRAYGAAREVFEIAARREDQSIRVQFMLAVSLILEERRPEAVDLLQEIIGRAPDFESAYRALGECHEEARNASSLVALGQKFIEREPESGTGYYLKGAGLLREAMDAGSSAAGAINALRQALSLAPEESEWRFTLAKALHLEKQYEEAERELHETLQMNPSHPRAHYILAQLYRRKGKMALARQELQVHDGLKDRDRGIRLLVESRPR